jgi:hypothetical protein
MSRVITRLAVGSCVIGVTVFATAPSVHLGPRPDAVHAQGPYKYTGAASCGGSNCHDQKPKPEFPRLNETAIWEGRVKVGDYKDKHSIAFATLTNEKLKSKISPGKIATSLKIAKAETSDRCLNCHALIVKPELRGQKLKIEDGVHCDVCHGPAEKWLEPHAEKGWTHEKSVAAGMYDTRNFLLRAEKCVSCHLAIDHELVEAGHPDLLGFELDTFSEQMPPHYRDRAPWAGTKAWATGQVISLREAAKQVADRTAANASAKLVDEAWKKVHGHASVVRHLLAVTAPDAQKQLDAEVGRLVEAAPKGAAERPKVAAAAKNVVTLTAQQTGRTANREFDRASTLRFMQAIAGDVDAVVASGLRGAEQTAMAIDRLYAAYVKGASGPRDKALDEAINKLFDTLPENPKAPFDAKAFAAQLKVVQSRLPK